MKFKDDNNFKYPSESSYAGRPPKETFTPQVVMVQPRAASPPEFPPGEGKTFLLRSRDKRRLVIEQLDDTLRVISEDEAGLGVAWRCIKTKNWYGFVNTVSGGRMSLDEEDVFQASGTEHGEWEWFAIDRHHNGGYILLMREEGGGLYQMAIADDGCSLEAVEEGGTAWDFFELEDVDITFRFADRTI